MAMSCKPWPTYNAEAGEGPSQRLAFAFMDPTFSDCTIRIYRSSGAAGSDAAPGESAQHPAAGSPAAPSAVMPSSGPVRSQAARGEKRPRSEGGEDKRKKEGEGTDAVPVQEEAA